MLKNSAFRKLLSAKFFSTLSLGFLIIPLLKWIELSTNQTEHLSLFFFFNALPFLLLSIPVGTWTQNRSTKKILLYTSLAMVAFGTIFMLNMNDLSYHWGYVFIMLDAIAVLFLSPAEKSMIPKIVEDKKLIHANSYFSFVETIPLVISNIIVVILIQNGVPLTYLIGISTLCWFISAIFIFRMKSEESTSSVMRSEAKEKFISKMSKDVITLFRNKTTLMLFTFFCLFLIISTPAEDLLIVNYLVEVLKDGTENLGYFNAAFILGKVIVLPFIPYLYKKFERKIFVILPFFIYSIYLLAMHAESPLLTVIILSMIFGSARNIFFVSLVNYIQEEVPKDIHGSAFGLHVFLSRGLKAPVMLVVTLVISSSGILSTSWYLAILCTFLMVLGIFFFPSIGKGDKEEVGIEEVDHGIESDRDVSAS